MLFVLLSKTMTSSGLTVCASMDARHSAVMAPPPASSTMTETSAMPHPVEPLGLIPLKGKAAAVDVFSVDSGQKR